MTFKECFIQEMKKLGQTDKAITLAVMQAEINGCGFEDREITDKEAKMMGELAGILSNMQAEHVVEHANKINAEKRGLN